MWRTAVVAYSLKYFSGARAFLTYKESSYNIFRCWCLVTREVSLKCNSKQNAPSSHSSEFWGAELILKCNWLNRSWESFSPFPKVICCCILKKEKEVETHWSQSRIFSLCMLVIHAGCLVNRCQWCNGSFYLMLVCHSPEESIVGAGWDWCPL